ncbi:10444_t:CDS:10 [Funneliformis caledonium]|uniref:10444_t:CDS:1 n=1 Tax=Funneliformis caledonium TaxID=1117310 RepID=A0A9N9A4A7_9GLOM|nr:10444_t:CDS:10 [Funneliformis caledonium]
MEKSGINIRVRTNFFEVTKLPEANIIHYDITISPDVSPILNRKVFRELERSAFDVVRPVFDGRKNMFTAKPLPTGDSATYEITLRDDARATTSKHQPKPFKIKIRKVNEINMEELSLFLKRKCSLTSNSLTAIMALDVLIRHRPSMMHETVGRSFYTPQGSQSLQGGVEVWQGYYQSARPTSGRIMMNLDVSATVFYESGQLVNIVAKILGRRTPEDLRRGLNVKDHFVIERFLKNVRINVIHRGEAAARRRFKIDQITPKSALETTFDSEGAITNVAEYFQQRYNKRLNYPFLPCVVVARKVYLPMEVCEIIKGQRYIRKLNGKQTADMIKFTCQPPHIRANKIKQGFELLNYRNNEYLQNFGMNIGNEMIVVPARVLPVPNLQYHPSSREADFQPREGVWNLRDKKVATGATLGSWSVVAFGTEQEYPTDVVKKFVRQLVITCIETGMNIPNMTPPISHANPQGDIEQSLKHAWINAGNTAKAQPQLILCVLPNIGVPLYAEIKRVTDTVIGVSSQCVQSRHIISAKKQYCANVCLKINVKLGGMNAFISPNQIPFIAVQPTIVMGADVAHPAPGDTKRPSIAVVCGSMDAKASRYSASIRIQTGRNEMIADLANMTKELLKLFYQTCGRKPERILFYRDGVSEGQFSQVLESEVAAVKAACASLDPKYKPTLTFIVVQKRHHTRFFPMEKRDTDRTGNCLPGTVVETGITRPFDFNFYLQSHAGLQGTSRSTHYSVLHDENDFTPKELGIQELSYNLCYVYARATRAVSVITPVYYAHIVCKRARFHSKESWSDTEDSEKGSDTSSTFGVVKPDLQRVFQAAKMTILKGYS